MESFKRETISEAEAELFLLKNKLEEKAEQLKEEEEKKRDEEEKK